MSDDHTPDAADEFLAQAEGDAQEAAQAEIASLKEQLLRYAAEAENTRRRAEREANDARAYAIQKFAKDLLGVADNLARAPELRPRYSVGGLHRPDARADHGWLEKTR